MMAESSIGIIGGTIMNTSPTSYGAWLAVAVVLGAVSCAQAATHLILGGNDDAEVLLLDPRQVEEGPHGDLYVLDAGDATIKVYSPTVPISAPCPARVKDPVRCSGPMEPPSASPPTIGYSLPSISTATAGSPSWNSTAGWVRTCSPT